MPYPASCRPRRRRRRQPLNTPPSSAHPPRSFSGSAPVAAPGAGFGFGAKYAAAVPTRGGGAAGPGDAGPTAVRAAAIIPADLDGELSQQLQKLGKRDATTKLKALQALRALAGEKRDEDLVAALPCWAYLFARLAMDGNRAVRTEACHVTAALVATVGRGVAPLLKALLPPLWLAQHDAYSEAAAAAAAACAAAFPTPAKQRDALLFCRAEVRRGAAAAGTVLSCKPAAAPLHVRLRLPAHCLHMPAPRCALHRQAWGQ